MVRANNGFQTWHLMQTISAAKCICDVKIINSRALLSALFSSYVCAEDSTTMLKTFHDQQIISGHTVCANFKELFLKNKRAPANYHSTFCHSLKIYETVISHCV